MAIQSLETFTADDTSVVRLRTDDGEVGYGQMATGGHEIATAAFHRLIAPHALGEIVENPGDLVDDIMETGERPRIYKFPGTFVLRALCGLDTALWDLRGKREGEPVCTLLGGATTTIRAYGSRTTRQTEASEEADVCARFRERGLEAFKLKAGKRLAYKTGNDQWPGRTEAVLSAVREAVPDADLMVDANGAYAPEKAIEVAEEVLKPNGVIHFEEPCPCWELEWTAAVREGVSMPVAGGEQDNMFQIWDRLIDTPAVDIIQPDVGYIGGVTRMKRVADRAASAGLPCVPHGPNHSLQKVFTLHVLAAIDNAGKYPFEYRIPDTGSHGMYDPEPTVEDGVLAVPDGPGWGVTVDPDWLATAAYEKSEVSG